MSQELGLTEAQAASHFNVHPSTLKRWRRNGAIGFTLTPGGRIRYSREDIRRLLIAMHVEPTLGKPLA